MHQNAIELLKSDHETVKKLLSQLMETSNNAERTREKLLHKIEKELEVHTKIEEEIFYPAFRKAGKKDDEPMVYEAREEHRAVEDLVVPDLDKTDLGSQEFRGRAKVLKELVEHHIEDEETEMFPRAEELLSADQLAQLGKEMAELKASLMQ